MVILNVYEAAERFELLHTVENVETFRYKNQYYPNDTIGFKFVDNVSGFTYYFLHYLQLEPNWKNLTGYYKSMESDAFFVPKKYVEQAAKDPGTFVTLAFIVDDEVRYILPEQLKSFYDGNDLAIFSEEGEIVVPVPLKMLSNATPFYR